MNKLWATLAGSTAAVLTLAITGCGSGSAGDSSTVTVAGEVPLACVKRANTLSMNPTDGANFAPGGDLIIREKSSPSAPEHDITARFTQGVGDASDPEVSYDGKKIVFSMRCPTTHTSTLAGAPPPGFMSTDPVALQARAEPNATAPTRIDAALAAQGLALIEVRSVYDTDGLERMGGSMLAKADLLSGRLVGIA